MLERVKGRRACSRGECSSALFCKVGMLQRFVAAVEKEYLLPAQ